MKKNFIFVFCLVVCSFLMTSQVIKAKSITIGSSDEWINAVKEWTDLMVEDGDWIYLNETNRTYWQDARKYSRTTNCALMVVHSLQRFGVFDKNNKVYSGDNHQLVYNSDATRKRLGDIADIYTYNSGLNPGNANLVPGDILYYSGHMNIYIGTENGKRMYYDAGRGTTVTGQERGTWNSFKTSLETHIIYGIIRLKFNQTVDIDGDVASAEDDGDESENNGSIKDPGFNVPSLQTGELDCDTLFLNSDGSEKEFKKLLDGFFNIIQISAPVIAIVLTIIDYIKVIASDGNSKKANSRTIKRIVIAVLIVFLPLLLNLLFHIFGLYDLSSCNIG